MKELNMGFLNWLRGDATRSAEDHAISSGYSFFFGATSSGRPVTERSAMQMTAVYSCVRILAEAIAGLPFTGRPELVAPKKNEYPPPDRA